MEIALWIGGCFVAGFMVGAGLLFALYAATRNFFPGNPAGFPPPAELRPGRRSPWPQGTPPPAEAGAAPPPKEMTFQYARRLSQEKFEREAEKAKLQAMREGGARQ